MRGRRNQHGGNAVSSDVGDQNADALFIDANWALGKGSSPLSTVLSIALRGPANTSDESRRFHKERETYYFGVLISLTEVAQLTKTSRAPPEMYSVAMKIFSPSAAAAE